MRLVAVGSDPSIRPKSATPRALREFLADTTHDLAIPLTVLQGHLSSLRDVQASAALDSAIDEAHYIGALLHNLGAAAKLEAHELALQRTPVELGALVMRVLTGNIPPGGSTFKRACGGRSLALSPISTASLVAGPTIANCFLRRRLM